MTSKEIIKQLKNIAVIGVTKNTEKYGYKIFARMKEMGKNVFGISPIYKEIDDSQTYDNLSEVNQKIDLAIFVVNPQLGESYVHECYQLGIKYIWLQPGTYDEQLIQLINEKGINYIQDCAVEVSKSIQDKIYLF